MIDEAEDIFAQVGVTFDIGDRISVTNIAEAYDVLWEGQSDSMWDFDRLVATHSNTGGLECYFVNSIITDTPDYPTIGGHSTSGIVVSSRGNGLTLAHEIGHSFGMDDVYRIVKHSRVLQGKAKWEWNMEDWNGGCNGSGSAGARYYAYGTTQQDLISRMLMDGRKVSVDSGVDITFGAVYGFDLMEREDVQETGYFSNVGHIGNPVHQ